VAGAGAGLPEEVCESRGGVSRDMKEGTERAYPVRPKWKSVLWWINGRRCSFMRFEILNIVDNDIGVRVVSFLTLSVP
jgi:hypothetical protein